MSKILVLAHSLPQLQRLFASITFFRMAYDEHRLVRVSSITDVRGRANAEVLYLLPEYEKGVTNPREILEYWWSFTENQVCAVSEAQVLGHVPFTPPKLQFGGAVPVVQPIQQFPDRSFEDWPASVMEKRHPDHPVRYDKPPHNSEDFT
jgi:hypothetical protein